ncbi:MAG TPA: hypothetical protein PLQ35_16025 [bacterium]|nr:hypothetical protein [bacterium]HQL63788.1 hypothetical protein [bacterium]
MKNEYTAVVKQDGDWWVGWIEEVPGVKSLRSIGKVINCDRCGGGDNAMVVRQADMNRNRPLFLSLLLAAIFWNDDILVWSD